MKDGTHEVKPSKEHAVALQVLYKSSSSSSSSSSSNLKNKKKLLSKWSCELKTVMYAVCLLVNWSATSIRRERLKKTLKELRSCVKVEVDVLGSPSLTVLMVSVDVKQHRRAELRSCVKVEVVILSSPSLTVLMVSVDVRQHWNMVTASELMTCVRVEVAAL